jgi:hypothetical protein
VVENGEQIFYPTASLSGTSVKMTVELLIPKSDKYVNVDTCFLNIYRIYCQNDKSDPKIELIQDLSIKDLTTKTGFYDLLDKSGVLDRYVIIDTGEAISDVTGLFGSTEDTKIQSVALKAKKIAVKDGSMYVGNIDIAGASNIEG